MASCGQPPQQQGAKIYALLDRQKKPGSAAGAYPQTRRLDGNILALPTGWRAHRIMNRCVLVDSERTLDAAAGRQVTAPAEALRQSSPAIPVRWKEIHRRPINPPERNGLRPRPTDCEHRALDKAGGRLRPESGDGDGGGSAETIGPSAGQTVTGRAGRRRTGAQGERCRATRGVDNGRRRLRAAGSIGPPGDARRRPSVGREAGRTLQGIRRDSPGHRTAVYPIFSQLLSLDGSSCHCA